MTMHIVHVPAVGKSPAGPWELISGFLFPPGTYACLWRGVRPEHVSMVRTKCLLDQGPPFPWASPVSGSWSAACAHRRRAGMTVVPVPPCEPCMLELGTDSLLAALAAGRPPSSMETRIHEVQASEVESRNVAASGYDIRRIQPSEPRPHPKDPSFLVPQWEPPEIESTPPTEVVSRARSPRAGLSDSSAKEKF